MDTRPRRVLTAASVVIVGAFSAAQADIVNVGPGDSIQDAIDAAMDGDEIVVAPGTYLESINYPDNKGVTVRSSHGPHVTVIDGQGANIVVTYYAGGHPCTLAGFTVTGGGIGIEVSYSFEPFTIDDCILADNGLWGLGVVEAYARFQNSVANNNGREGILVVDGFDVSVTNCLIVNNRGRGIYSESCDAVITNCTIWGNSDEIGGGVYVRSHVYGPASMQLLNCIIGGNIAIDASHVKFKCPAITVDHCAVPGQSGVTITNANGECLPAISWTNNLNVFPLLVDPDNDDFHLTPDSPCIDAGDNDAVPVDVFRDLEGNPRILKTPGACPQCGPVVDMGAYEFAPYQVAQ